MSGRRPVRADGDPGTARRRPSRVLVLGTGVTGRAAQRLLAHEGIESLAYDPGSQAVAQAVAALNAVDLVVPSPGIPEHDEILRAACQSGVPVCAEPELAMWLRPHDLLAITGTNGKTTTTELVTAMLVRGGRRAVACGNIGLPVSDAVIDNNDDVTLVAELSSFHLRWCWRLRPRVGALLNLADDHLDWHGDTDAYRRAKSRIWRAQHADDWAVVNAEDATTRAMAEAYAPSQVAMFSGRGPVEEGVGRRGEVLVAFGPSGTTEVVDIAELAVPSGHHVDNVAAAATVATLAGVELDAVAAAARSYTPGAHRMELIATIDGVRYVDDSKATNPHATASALDATAGIVWIAGGRAKGVDLHPLADHLGSVRHALLIGEASGELHAICRAAGVAATAVGDLDAAVERSTAITRPGDTVLLSPACASFDQFRDYVDRGERFRAAVARVGEDSRRNRARV